jgi:hypothetical protein
LQALAHAYLVTAAGLNETGRDRLDDIVHEVLLGRSVDLAVAFNAILSTHEDASMRRSAARNLGREALKGLDMAKPLRNQLAIDDDPSVRNAAV